jgi:transcriptional antiterminator
MSLNKIELTISNHNPTQKEIKSIWSSATNIGKKFVDVIKI